MVDEEQPSPLLDLKHWEYKAKTELTQQCADLKIAKYGSKLQLAQRIVKYLKDKPNVLTSLSASASAVWKAFKPPEAPM